MTALKPFPDSAARHRHPFALACAASLLFHGGVFAAVHWGWQSTTQPQIPPMVAIPVIDAARLKPPAAAPAPPSAIAATAKEATRTEAPAPSKETEAKAMPKPAPSPPQNIQANAPPPPARPAWTLNPPVPPRRPLALANLEPVPPPKPASEDPLEDTPPLVKPVPVTAPRADHAKLRAASSVPAGTIATAPPAPAARPGLARASAAGLGNPPPAYPWISRQRGEEGRVILDVDVTSEGRAQTVRIKRSSGSPRLDQAALNSVKDWRFAPARRAGKPVAGRIDVPITFRLTD